MTVTPTAAALAPHREFTSEELEAGRSAYALDRQHVFHSWSAQETLSPLTVLDAEGSWIWDGEGLPLLDLTSQLIYTNVGHKHPAVVQAIRDQAEKLCTVALSTPTTRAPKPHGSSSSACPRTSATSSSPQGEPTPMSTR